MQHAFRWNGSAYVPLTSALSRFCSGDLPALTAFYNPVTARVRWPYLYEWRGERNGRPRLCPFLDGNSYELPFLGKMSFENSVANPATGDKTVVVSTDEWLWYGSQVYVYVGEKSTNEDRLTAAGLKNGTTFAIRVPGLPLVPAVTGVPPRLTR
jgi:hypothetical protein